MPRFVVLRHAPDALGGKPLHWDFMLERGNALSTWSLAAEPRQDLEIHAELLPDHRLEYLDYEGAISGNRGHVQQWDAGTYRVLAQDADALRIRVDGRRLQGEVSLERSANDAQRWIFALAAFSSTNDR